MVKAVENAHARARGAIVASMRNVYWLAKENVANDKLSSLNKLCLVQVSVINILYMQELRLYIKLCCDNALISKHHTGFGGAKRSSC